MTGVSYQINQINWTGMVISNSALNLYIRHLMQECSVHYYCASTGIVVGVLSVCSICDGISGKSSKL